MVVCLEILAEYREVAVRLSQKYQGIDILSLIDLVTVRSQIVRAAPLSRPVCDDPKDAVFLACAISGNARIVISGDRHLLKVTGFRGIQVLRPKAFPDAFL